MAKICSALSNKKLFKLSLIALAIFFLGFSGQGASALVSEPLVVQAAALPQWHHLGHYRPGIWGGWRSDISSRQFFLSSEGPTNPEAELREFLRQLEINPELACRFPARSLFVQKQLGVQSEKINCPEFQAWQKELQADSVALVFASSFLGSPTSIFGHTFLKFSGKNRSVPELMEMTLSYGAVFVDDNPLLYAPKGLWGGYQGKYLFFPYHRLVKDYSHLENRELWVYPLELNETQMAILRAHLWEIRESEEPYWFLSENCSTKLIQVLSVAEPTVAIENLPKTFVSPLDTVQFVQQSPLRTAKPLYRPSLVKKYKAVARTLARQLENAPAPSEVLQAQSLDVEILKLQVLHPYEIEIKTGEVYQQFSRLLEKRLELPAEGVSLSGGEMRELPPPVAPDEGHSPRRLNLGALDSSDYATGVSMGYCFWCHESLDGANGFPQDQELSIFKFRFLAASRAPRNQPPGLQFEELQLLRLRAFNFEALDYSPSWSFDLQLGQNKSEGCANCPSVTSTFGIGGGTKLTPTLVIDGGLRAIGGWVSGGANQIAPHSLLGIGPQLTLLWFYSPTLTGLIETWFRKDQAVEYSEFKETRAGLQWFLRRQVAVRVVGVDRWYERQLDLGLQLYF